MNARQIVFGWLVFGGLFSLHAQLGDTITWQRHTDKETLCWNGASCWEDASGVNRLPAENDTVVIPRQSSYPYSGTTIIYR